MIEGARRLSRRHITVRVPWHDTGWTGRVCAVPSANTSCLALARIAKSKRLDESKFAGECGRVRIPIAGFGKVRTGFPVISGHRFQ